jgi:cation diffusion facilitator CzcD-associated flavoprotein CzcO
MSKPELPRVVDLGKNSVAIVGAGLVGSLLGIYLRKFHYSVSIFEARPDPRKNPDAGRSINLVLTSRGIAALTGMPAPVHRRRQVLWLSEDPPQFPSYLSLFFGPSLHLPPTFSPYQFLLP